MRLPARQVLAEARHREPLSARSSPDLRVEPAATDLGKLSRVEELILVRVGPEDRAKEIQRLGPIRLAEVRSVGPESDRLTGRDEALSLS